MRFSFTNALTKLIKSSSLNCLQKLFTLSNPSNFIQIHINVRGWSNFLKLFDEIKEKLSALATCLIEILREWEELKPERGIIENFFKVAKNTFNLDKFHSYTDKSLMKNILLTLLLTTIVVQYGFKTKTPLKRLRESYIDFEPHKTNKKKSKMSDFLWHMRSFIQKQNNVSYVFSGSMSVKDSLIEKIAGSEGAFGGRILTIEIKPLSYETTKNYLNDNAGYLKFSDDGFEEFYNCTKGIPFYINIFGNLLPKDEILDSYKSI